MMLKNCLCCSQNLISCHRFQKRISCYSIARLYFFLSYFAVYVNSHFRCLYYSPLAYWYFAHCRCFLWLLLSEWPCLECFLLLMLSKLKSNYDSCTLERNYFLTYPLSSFPFSLAIIINIHWTSATALLSAISFG